MCFLCTHVHITKQAELNCGVMLHSKNFLYNPVIELSSAICMDMRNYKLDLHIKIVHER